MKEINDYAIKCSKIADYGIDIRKEILNKGFLAGQAYYDYWYKFCQNNHEKEELELLWKELFREANGKFINKNGTNISIDGSFHIITILNQWRKEAKAGIRPQNIVVPYQREFEYVCAINKKNKDNSMFSEKLNLIRDAFLVEISKKLETPTELIKLIKMTDTTERFNFFNQYINFGTNLFINLYQKKGFVFDEQSYKENNICCMKKLLSNRKTIILCILDRNGMSFLDTTDDFAWYGSCSFNVETHLSNDSKAFNFLLSSSNIKKKFRKIHHPIYDYVAYKHYFNKENLQRCLEFWVALTEIEELVLQEIFK